jgi:hypothetical protein
MTLLLAPRPRSGILFLQLRCGFFCLPGDGFAPFLPRGLGAVARVAHRAQPSDAPPRATELAQTGVQSLAVPRPRAARSCSASVSTRRFGRSVPARSGGMAPIARWADFTPTLPFAIHMHKWSRCAGTTATQLQSADIREGGFQSAGAAGGKSLRSPRAPDARAALGRRRRSVTRTPRGPGADRTVRSRAKEFAAAGRGGGQGRTASHRRQRQIKDATR